MTIQQVEAMRQSYEHYRNRPNTNGQVVCLLIDSHEALRARVAELEAELAQLRTVEDNAGQVRERGEGEGCC